MKCGILNDIYDNRKYNLFQLPVKNSNLNSIGGGAWFMLVQSSSLLTWKTVLSHSLCQIISRQRKLSGKLTVDEQAFDVLKSFIPIYSKITRKIPL